MQPTSLRKVPFALGALYVVVSLIAFAAYAICAWQVFGFSSHVWRLPRELSFGAAVVADLLSLAGLFATYQLRRASGWVQAYAWAVFLGMAGLSIAAAESYATWRFAPIGAKPETVGDARVASAAIVIALALAVHLLIICRNHAPGAEAPPALQPPRLKRERSPRWPRFERPAKVAPAPAQPKPHEVVAATFPHVDPDRTLAPLAPAVGLNSLRLPVLQPGERRADAAEMYPYGTLPAPAPTADWPPIDKPAARRREVRPNGPHRPAARPTPKSPGTRGAGRPVDADKQARRDSVAHDVMRGRITKAEAAATAGVSVKSIENWCKSYEQRQPLVIRTIPEAAGPQADRPDLKTPMLGPGDVDTLTALALAEHYDETPNGAAPDVEVDA